jgi:hypothetical protein
MKLAIFMCVLWTVSNCIYEFKISDLRKNLVSVSLDLTEANRKIETLGAYCKLLDYQVSVLTETK